MSLYHLPQGQYGYSGHVINLPQDVAAVVNSLPRMPSDLDVIIVRKEGSDQSHRDFHVRRSVVLDALRWLLQNNIYYHNITINYDALLLLPENGNLIDLPSVTIESESTVAQHEDAQDRNLYDAHLSRTFVPVTGRKMTEQETIRQAVHDTRSQQPSAPTPALAWPSCGSPVNEFNTEGYMSTAFPTLFPTGAGNFLAPRQCAVTIGYFFKHLMMYQDGRFARHPRFRYFALNTEMRWRALQTGRIYVHQHPQDARLTVEELRDMVGREGEIFSSRVLHYATSLRGTRQYWFKQRSQLIAMIDTLGLPTVFITHSAADLHWPELARLICPSDQTSSSARSTAVIENPAIADWFFHYRIEKFITAFYIDVLGATDYWIRYEWQHRGSPHVHGLVWFPNAPNVEKIIASTDHAMKEQFLKYVDKFITTINPAVLHDGTNAEHAPAPKTNPHICNKPYCDINDFDEDLADLVATCQRHTRCSAAYCLRTHNGEQNCRFGFPKPLQLQTSLVTEDGEPVLYTKRNDGLVNSYNPVQLSAWRANVDIQYCVSRHKVIQYCAKYATKCEPRSQALKDVFTSIVRNMTEDNTSLKAVQKLLINSVGERDYSAQETCLQLPMYRASRDFVVLSMDGCRVVETHLEDGQPATAPSTLDHYIARPTTSHFSHMTLLNFVQQYTIPKDLGSNPSCRRKKVVVIVRPFCSPDPNGPKYEQYCKQKLMLHKPFRQQEELLADSDTYATAYSIFLQSENVPPSLEDDIHRLEQQSQLPSEDDNDEVWIMLVCFSVLNILSMLIYKHLFSPLESPSANSVTSKRSGGMDVNMPT